MSRKRDGARNFLPMPQKIFNLGMNAGEIAVYRALMNHFVDETHETYICEKCKYEKKYSFQIVYLGATQEVNVNYIPEDEFDELWTPSN